VLFENSAGTRKDYSINDVEKFVDSIKYEESQTVIVPWIPRVAILNFQDSQSLNYKESEHLLGKNP
jgi:hypothetical protein